MAAPGDKALLRFLACGSVDDGKSTLIGRLLFESGAIPDDQLAALERDSKRFGTQGGATDYALLLDGLIAEREQNITIDVAYRYFSTGRRAFIVADAPGHEQYTRNMATAASTADAAVILVDARKGLLPQTCRHSCIARLLGIRHVALAVNKLDVADYSRDVFDAIATRYREFAARIGLQQVTCLPLSALRGDNVSSPSDRMPWYEGPTLRDWLETVEPERRAEDGAFRMPVQWVNRPGPDFRGYCGPVVGGRLRPGDRVRVQPSGVDAVVARIVERDGDLAEARAGQSVTVVLDRDLDVARGDLLAAADSPAQVSDQFQATIVWMGEADMLPGRRYLIKAGTRTVGLAFGTPRHKLNIETLERVAARTLQLNDIGVCHIALDAPIAFDPYKANRDTGSFIVIDRTTNATVGAGMLDYGLHRAQNLHGQAFEVDKAARAALKGQKPCVVWFTGLSGAGKSTIANLVEKRLHAAGVHTCLLDGDNIRQGLNRDLGFTEAARVENIRRVAEVAKLMVDAGLVVLVAFISPFRAERRFARSLVEPGEFFEVFVDAPLAEAERRDPKGLYRKARRGELANFTGIDSPYEPPENPEARIDTTATTAEEAADALIVRMRLR